MSEHGRLLAVLRAARRRLRRRERIEEGTAAAAALGGSALALVLIASLIPPSPLVRSLGWALLVSTAVAVAVVVARPLLLFRDDERVARWLGKKTGAGDLLLSALQLGRSPDILDSEPSGTSSALVRAFVAQAADRAARFDLRALVPLLRARKRVAAATVVLLAWIAALAIAPHRLAAGLSAMTSREALSEVASEPILGDITLTLTYPKHTGLPPRTIPGTSGEVLAPPGTEVTIVARPLVEAESAELLVEDAQGKAIETRHVEVKGDKLQASFRVAGPGGYRFAIQPPSGRAVREPDAHRVDVEADRPPRVELAAPADDLEVAGPKRVELAWSAEDDYGLGDVELVWKPAEEEAGDDASAEQRKLVRPATVGRSASGKLEWDLGDLDLQPGVRIAYHLEAKDNDDVSGPNVGRSRTLYVRIYSPAETHAELLQHEQDLLDHAVHLLGDRLELTGVSDEDDHALDQFVAAHGRSEALLGELGRVAADLDKDTLAPKDLKPALTGIHERLGKLTRDEDSPLRDARARAMRGSRPQLRALRDSDPKHVSELERDVLLLDDLIQRQRLEDLLAVTDEMNRARDRLKQLLAEYKKTRSEAVRKEIEREMRQLERKLQELAERASKLQGEVPDEFLNRDALAKGEDMKNELDKMRELLAKGDVDGAMALLNKMSQSLDKMSQAMEQDLKGFRDERFSPEERALADLENKLADLEHEERAVESDAEAVRKEESKRADQLLKERIEPVLKKLKDEAQELKKRVGEVDPQTLSPYDQEQLEDAKKKADDLGHALEQGDLDQGRTTARDGEKSLKQLGAELRAEEQRLWEGMKGPMKRAREKVDDAGKMARDIGDQLDKVMPKPGELEGPGDRRKLEELRGRQAALRRQLGDAQRELEKRSREAAAGLGDGMKEAGSHMERAEDKLGQGDPRESSSEAREAADALKQARQQARDERRPRREGAGGAGAKEVVKIPGADEYKGPAEFRKDLLDAMKREAPRDYKEQVRRYYEELAR